MILKQLLSHNFTTNSALYSSYIEVVISAICDAPTWTDFQHTADADADVPTERPGVDEHRVRDRGSLPLQERDVAQW